VSSSHQKRNLDRLVADYLYQRQFDSEAQLLQSRTLSDDDELLLVRNPGSVFGAAARTAGKFGKDLAHTVATTMAIDKFRKKVQPHGEPNPVIDHAVKMVGGPHDPKLVK
jgi:hypothetical protein